jgi:hypothetical protein
MANLGGGSAVFVQSSLEVREWKKHAGHNTAGLDVAA